MNKKEIEVITPADLYIKKSLADYPKETLKLFYDEESIAIDEKLYQVLKHKAIPLWVDRNYVEEKRRNTKNMEEALELIKEKCKKENINTRQEFNEKIAIHYNLEQIISGYLKILDNTRYGHFDEIQDEKIDFLKQIISIIDIEKEYKAELKEATLKANKLEIDIVNKDNEIEALKQQIEEFKNESKEGK